jgi:hypothetical protein
MAMLAMPATESTREAVMKGHLLPRKSKLVFLNISMQSAVPVPEELDTGFPN